MPTLIRVRRTNVDASPNEMATNADASRPFAFDGYRITNSNSSDIYVHFYQETSGNVTVGTTEQMNGAILVPASSQLGIRAYNYIAPECFAVNAITVAATTTETGSASPTLDVTVEIFYWKF